MRESERSHNSIWLQAFARFKTWTSARPRLLALAGKTVLFAVLLIPSIWMLSVIPPLWRDVDAYIQVTEPPGVGTILHYGPLYCFVARIPLYLGYIIDRFSAGGPLPALRFFLHPILTDSGVFALLVSQHTALCCSTFYLITLVSRLFWVRLTLAIACAANPLFYTFAHCIGTETLSMIILLLIAATGLRIVRYSRKVPGKEWVFFAILLWFCILTRHINAGLAGLMPAAFILLAVSHIGVVLFVQSPTFRRWRRLKAKQALLNATVAVAIGIGSIGLANASLRVMCHAAQIPYYSFTGYTFLGRLKFLAALAPEKRNELLDQVARHAASADVRKMISLVREAVSTEPSKLDMQDFRRKTKALLLTPQTDPHDEKLYFLLNRMAWAFLWPPREVLLSAVATDFKKSQQITIPEVVRSLFVNTRFYFSHRDVVPQYASLITFRDKNADQIFAIFKSHSYFRHPKKLTYQAFLLIWLVLLALFLVIAKTYKREAADVASYAVGLTALGLFMMLANCLIAVFQPPRYTLPMWELTIVSLVILFGAIMDCLFSPSCRPHSLKRNEQAKYSEQVRES